MKTILSTLMLAAALILPGATPAQNAPAPAEDPAHAELRKLREGVLTAINRGDLEGVLAFMHSNVVITWHNAEVSRGHQGVRAYFDKVMKGPNRIVESFTCDVTVDELTTLYGGTTGICFGGTDEHFKLSTGKNLNVKGRWSATLIQDNGRWVVASLHASTNLFDNVLLNLAKKAATLTALIGLIFGLVLGWLISRRARPKT